MKYKLTLLFIFSFIVHITIAGALVYVPYQISMQGQQVSGEEVIWGRIQGRKEGRRQKVEGRSKKQALPQGEGKIEKHATVSEPFRSLVLTKDDENESDKNVPPIHNIYLDKRGFLTPPEGSSDELNVNTGKGDAVLLASSDGGESYTGEGDETKAEKGRIYNEQLKGLIEQVKNEIEKNKYYPFLARLKGIEGTVYVNFHIGQNGKPGSVAIQKSSGSKILDESAVKTIMNLKPFRNINPELRELDITVPITYRLRVLP